MKLPFTKMQGAGNDFVVIDATKKDFALSRKQIDGFYHKRYRPETMVIAAAGNLDHAKVVNAVRAAFDQAGLLDTAEPAARRSRTTRVPARSSGSRMTPG